MLVANSLNTHEFDDLRHQRGVTDKLIDEYRFFIATTNEEKQRAFRLRHDVFLKEFNYEMHEDESKVYESDTYDNYSVHCLIEHKRSGMLAGCVRLVMPTNESPTSPDHLPVQDKGAQLLNHPTLTPSKLPKLETCEVSRLAISKRFRTRKSATPEEAAGEGIVFFSQDEAKTFSLIALGLFLCTYSIVGLTHRRHVFAMMEPRLPRLLAISGFRFTNVSAPIVYHGIRHAYYIDYHVAEQEMSERLYPLYEHIVKTLNPQVAHVPLFLN
ncbi:MULTISPECIES: PEP-CTERM/exosortase system-associated acyltransferase [Vreelandella]|uniref:PEP-CTERM/exosortase system-associated acyltransferase n=2 Tax=Vreelandella TaxID=3137766 RepID=A0A7C9NQY3_9GAMM|nr:MULTISPECIES: PEP-CTERM/exosortase system-associated acyltransferase [Halomonas]NDL70747.1 PEP-CTERM/exosortase system-associated acyltransferase [Halomonas alkaliphila]NYS45248.1 PEP-CTERM/exosortase system-associated acyltransferase [Halomonas zhaodongensis]